MSDYRRLATWRKSYRLVLAVYRASEGFPDSERFGLTSQARRAAVSVVANIAEGAGRGSERELIRFLWISRGSAIELAVLLRLARDLGYLDPAEASPLLKHADELGRMITGLLKALGAITSRQSPPSND